ncbi:Senescence regulator [Fagus crenata]
MAASKSYYARPSYRFLPNERDQHTPIAHDTSFEIDESEIYNSVRSDSPEFRKPFPSSRLSKKSTSKPSRADAADRVVAGGTPSSLPVNIPDWSKILRDEYKDNRRRDSVDDDEWDCDDESENGVRVPPHEFLAKQMARTRIASFSVHEGVGRTLKGRDLSRVRNAIWEKTGFQD